jgi:hypothetical protein
LQLADIIRGFHWNVQVSTEKNSTSLVGVSVHGEDFEGCRQTAARALIAMLRNNLIRTDDHVRSTIGAPYTDKDACPTENLNVVIGPSH